MILEELFRKNQQVKEICRNATEKVKGACYEKRQDYKDESVKQISKCHLTRGRDHSWCHHSFPRIGNTTIQERSVQGNDELPTSCRSNFVLCRCNPECWLGASSASRLTQIGHVSLKVYSKFPFIRSGICAWKKCFFSSNDFSSKHY